MSAPESGHLSFPKGFLWGAATSSYQVEGGIENNDWAKAGREGKVPLAREACDHYHRYEEDLDIAKSLGLSSFRFSIEWSRIEPEEGVFNEKELRHYQDVVRAIRARGMEPLVTLWHFTLPEWFVEKGSFYHHDAPALFARYCAQVAQSLGSAATYYTTMNEPLVWVGNGHVDGIWPPFKKNILHFFTLPSKLARAHNAAYRAIKEVSSIAQVGATKNNLVFEDTALTWLFNLDSWLEYLWDTRFYNAIRDHQDFIGMNHYFRVVLGKKKNKKECPRSDLGWELSPHTIYTALMEVKKYNIPVYIMEHGLADSADQHRSWYIVESLKAVHQAIEDGVDVRGYAHWSLIDNFEWAEGFGPRFGLVEIDYTKDKKRTLRESALRYAQICKNNAL